MYEVRSSYTEDSMQARMKKYPLPENQVRHILTTESVGRLATIGIDGYPYVTPVHFVHREGKIFIHGLAAGEKLMNLKNRPMVGFEVEKMFSLVHDDERPCGTNTEYESVIIKGNAAMVEDVQKKSAVLDAIVAKYTPQHVGRPYPPNMLRMTGVIEITIQSCTGKYYPA